MSLGALKSKRSRSQGQGLLFGGGPPRRKPLRRMVGEPKPAGRRESKQKTAAPPGAARPLLQAVKRSGAREMKGKDKGEPQTSRNSHTWSPDRICRSKLL